MRRLRDGDRRRRRAALTHWLLVRGRGEHPLDARVDPVAIRGHSSSRRPAVRPGEQAILYAAVWQSVFAVVEIVGEPEHDTSKEGWSWRFAIRPLLVLDDLDRAPAVEEAGVFPQSIWRHSHIRLSGDQFVAAARLIEAAGGRRLANEPRAPPGRALGDAPPDRDSLAMHPTPREQA